MQQHLGSICWRHFLVDTIHFLMKEMPSVSLTDFKTAEDSEKAKMDNSRAVSKKNCCLEELVFLGFPCCMAIRRGALYEENLFPPCHVIRTLISREDRHVATDASSWQSCKRQKCSLLLDSLWEISLMYWKWLMAIVTWKFQPQWFRRTLHTVSWRAQAGFLKA